MEIKNGKTTFESLFNIIRMKVDVIIRESYYQLAIQMINIMNLNVREI